MKTIHYPNTIRSHLVTIVPMAPFTPKSTSKLRSALHFRYLIVTPRFISALILLNPNNHCQGLNHYSRMATNLNLTTIDQFPYCHHYRKVLNM